MRTTLTIDADLATAIQERARRTGATWKEVVNDAIRNGLHAQPPEPPRYVTPVYDPGPPLLVGVYGVHDLLAIAEGDSYR